MNSKIPSDKTLVFELQMLKDYGTESAREKRKRVKRQQEKMMENIEKYGSLNDHMCLDQRVHIFCGVLLLLSFLRMVIAVAGNRTKAA